ncbi:hypothetical protein M0811_01888 [Anaeramoeba ignava]|uniref:NADAR domain-containing protein n=1 Tax=Anaeramoeba ignava TaxID=1746090 RepID=A0A9Q0LDJ8_ANAIG|nr:hypothetical protein M0811_01888 [Anaeramoeba ignava]
MKEVVFAKFDQNEELKKLLFETGDALLVEDARNDYYWGRGASGKGKNKLGHILMEVRAELKEKEEKKEKENEKEKK